MKRNKFSLSHYKLLTADMGNLIPLTWYEALPGDTIRHSTSMLLRCSPLNTPVMHPVRIRLHHWFVPNRLIWDDWEDFITGGKDGLNASVHPYISSAAITEGSLHDYLGVPVDAAYSPNLTYSALPFRAYNLIFNEHYRDEQLITEKTIDHTDGQDTTTDVNLHKVSWEKDYFTTARPDSALGNAVNIPLTGDAPITGLGKGDQTFPLTNQAAYLTDGTAIGNLPSAQIIHNAASEAAYIEEDPNNSGYPNIRADLSSVSGVTINDLRLALALQRYQEARNRFGSRYTEWLRSQGVKSSDQRLQRPEYLGGGRQVISFSEVLSTDGANTGDMKGHGISAMKSKQNQRYFEEHGICMTLMSVVPKAIYTTALHKKWSREAKEDYFTKELSQLGEQAVLNKEVQAEHSAPDTTFGYQARYNDLRTMPSSISGEFLSTLDTWHYGRIFTGDVALNQSFIDCTPTKRVNASTATDCLYIMANHSVQARRLMPQFVQPKTY